MIRKVYGKINYEICILLFSLTEVFLFMPKISDIDTWCFISYFGDYSHGITSRFFIGEVFSWFTDFITTDFLYKLSVTALIILCILLSFLGGKIIRKSDVKLKSISIVLVAFVIASPIFLPLLSGWLGLTDVYLVILTIVALIFSENKFLKWLIPIIMVVCVLIHQCFLFTYMVLTSIVLLYNCFKGKHYVRDGILCFITYASLIGSGLFIFFARGNIDFSTSKELSEYMASRTDMNLPIAWLSNLTGIEYFSGTDTLFSEVIKSFISPKNLLGIVLIVFPMLAVFSYGWITAIRNCKKKTGKLIFIFCLIQPLSAIPSFITATNWNRWTAPIIFTQCSLYLFFIFKNDESVKKSLEKIQNYFKNHLGILVIYLIYYASFAKLLGM